MVAVPIFYFLFSWILDFVIWILDFVKKGGEKE